MNDANTTTVYLLCTLSVFHIVLMITLNNFAKYKLHELLSTSIALFVVIFWMLKFLLIGNYSLSFYSLLVLAVISMFIVKSKAYVIHKNDISWRPIFLTLLFICSYILGVVSINLTMPWPIAYLLPMLCFLSGLIIYKKTRQA